MKGKKIKDDGQNSLKLAFSLKEDKVDEGLIRSCLLSQSFDRPQKQLFLELCLVFTAIFVAICLAVFITMLGREELQF